MCSICVLTLTAQAQNQMESNTTTTVSVSTNPILVQKAQQIKEKEAQLAAASTSSRGVYAQLKEEKTTLLKEYSTLLNSELSLTTDAVQQAALKEELARVNAELTTASQTR